MMRTIDPQTARRQARERLQIESSVADGAVPGRVFEWLERQRFFVGHHEVAAMSVLLAEQGRIPQESEFAVREWMRDDLRREIEQFTSDLLQMPRGDRRRRWTALQEVAESDLVLTSLVARLAPWLDVTYPAVELIVPSDLRPYYDFLLRNALLPPLTSSEARRKFEVEHPDPEKAYRRLLTDIPGLEPLLARVSLLYDDSQEANLANVRQSMWDAPLASSQRPETYPFAWSRVLRYAGPIGLLMIALSFMMISLTGNSANRPPVTYRYPYSTPRTNWSPTPYSGSSPSAPSFNPKPPAIPGSPQAPKWPVVSPRTTPARPSTPGRGFGGSRSSGGRPPSFGGASRPGGGAPSPGGGFGGGRR